MADKSDKSTSQLQLAKAAIKKIRLTNGGGGWGRAGRGVGGATRARVGGATRARVGRRLLAELWRRWSRQSCKGGAGSGNSELEGWEARVVPVRPRKRKEVSEAGAERAKTVGSRS